MMAMVMMMMMIKCRPKMCARADVEELPSGQVGMVRIVELAHAARVTLSLDEILMASCMGVTQRFRRRDDDDDNH